MKTNKSAAQKPMHIVGIGASAGGVEALQSFFKHVPNDLGAAYVIVQYFSPDFKNMLSEAISENTTMPIHQANENEKILKDHVYIIPFGKLIHIKEGHICLSDLPLHNHVNLPINEFFKSLAEDIKEYAIGIILSGTGSDGSRGIQALKEAGSMVIVQDPDEAEFDSMPISAVNTGAADFILKTKDMPNKLINYISHPLRTDIDDKFRSHLSNNSDILEKILNLIQKETELDFKAYKESTVSRRIEHRMGIRNITSLQKYYEYIKENKNEADLIKQDLLIGVTQFFRDPETWDELRKQVVEPLLLGSNKNEPVRIWSTGCSTGEEPYTLAILFADTMQTLGIHRQVKVFASDIDQNAVSFAANGIYPSSIAAEVPKELLNTYFDQLPDGAYRITKEIRSMVVFATHNLIQDPPFSNMNLISCRNTLIYLQTPAQQKALAFFHFALRLNGYMLLGSAETPGSFSNYFEAIDSRLRIYKKTKDLRIPVTSISHKNIKDRGYNLQTIPQYLARNAKEISHHKVKPFGYSALMETFVPPTLIFNNKLQVIYSHGDTSPFTRKIKPGQITNDISDILDPSIVSQAISAAHQVVRQKKSILLENVFETTQNNVTISWSLKSFAFYEKDLHSELVAISFIQDEANTPKRADVQYNPDEQVKQRINELDKSLVESQKLYREVVEELDSTSEELQSSNEELMAANEELQSTNEELQSVNEELYTVNSEYQQKILELTNSNNDLENLIKATKMAVVFLDENLKIRRYTEAFRDFVNIIHFDIDREFKDLSLKNDFKDLHEQIAYVNTTGEAKTINYDMHDGSFVIVTIAPYLTGKKHQGVVISMRRDSEE